jgi:methylglutaconyl-CoA hydratase
MVPSCIGPFVVAKIGASHARAYFISAERFPAERALEIGLVHEVVIGMKELTQAGERIVGNILQAAPGAVSVAKKLVLDLSWPERRAKEPDCIDMTAKLLAELRVKPEGQEGLKAFLEKRKPSWSK